MNAESTLSVGFVVTHFALFCSDLVVHCVLVHIEVASHAGLVVANVAVETFWD